MLHTPLRTTSDNAAHAGNNNGKIYLNNIERLLKERLARRVPLPNPSTQQNAVRLPCSHQGVPPPASAGTQDSHSLLGKRKAAHVHTDGHDHEGSALNAPGDACADYQTCEDLWDALSASLKSSSNTQDLSTMRTVHANFRGSYAFVADPKTPSRRRVELVSKDLRRFAKLPHSETKDGTQQRTASCCTATYHCECNRGGTPSLPPPAAPQPPPTLMLAPPLPTHAPRAAPAHASHMSTSPVHAPATPAPPVKRTPTQRTLAGWLTGTHQARKAPATAEAVGRSEGPTRCGGWLHITVEEVPHPLGYYVGQRVTVVLEHPRW